MQCKFVITRPHHHHYHCQTASCVSFYFACCLFSLKSMFVFLSIICLPIELDKRKREVYVISAPSPIFFASIDFRLFHGTCSQMLFPCIFSDAIVCRTCCNQDPSNLPGFHSWRIANLVSPKAMMCLFLIFLYSLDFFRRAIPKKIRCCAVCIVCLFVFGRRIMLGIFPRH